MKHMTGRNQCALALTLGSMLLLLPGLLLPVLHLDMNGGLSSDFGQFNMGILRRQNSVITTILELQEHGQLLVAFLIFLFSVLVPVLKGILTSVALLTHKRELARKIGVLTGLIGKWSMADVFVVAIFLVFLSNQSQPAISQHHLQVFGLSLKLRVNITVISALGEGFWFFLAYCLLSVAGFQLARPGDLKES
ncbi:MAG: paraquat-inducible protein A [Deltaproteobacteria bacterium]|nr:paraquat-inducible protein A [Deltaproteobacteria bacterium]